MMTLLWEMLNLFYERYPYVLFAVDSDHCRMEMDLKATTGMDKAVRQFYCCSSRKLLQVLGIQENSARLAKLLRNWDGTDKMNQAGKAIHAIVADTLSQPASAAEIFDSQMKKFRNMIEMHVIWNASTDPGRSDTIPGTVDRIIPSREACLNDIYEEVKALMDLLRDKGIFQDLFLQIDEYYPDLKDLTSAVTRQINDLRENDPPVDDLTETRYLAILTAVFLMVMNYRYEKKIDAKINEKAAENIWQLLLNELQSALPPETGAYISPAASRGTFPKALQISGLLSRSREQLERHIGIKYGASSGLRPDLLCQVSFPGSSENYGSLKEFYADYKYRQQDHFSDAPEKIRLRFMGDMVSGRTSQFLDLWAARLQQEEIVWYIPAEDLRRETLHPAYPSPEDPEEEHSGELKWEGLFQYIRRLYLPEHALPCDPFSGEDVLAYHISEYLSGHPVLLLIDDVDCLTEGLREEVQHYFLSGGWFDNINIICSARRGYQDQNNLRELRLLSLEESRILEILHKAGLRPNRQNPVFSYLSSPWFLRLVLDERLSLSGPIRNSAILIGTAIDRRIRRAVHLEQERALMEFAEGRLLPLITAAAWKHEYEAHPDQTREYVLKENVIINLLPELLSLLESEMDASCLVFFRKNRDFPRILYRFFFEEPIIKRLDLFNTAEEKRLRRAFSKEYRWKEGALFRYYHALGVVTLRELSLTHRENEDLRRDVLFHLGDYLHQMSLFSFHWRRRRSASSYNALTAFDCSRFLLELLEPEDEADLTAGHPNEMFSLYTQMSTIYERFGDAMNRYHSAVKAFDLYTGGSVSEELSDQNRLAAYFIIKTDPRTFRPSASDPDVPSLLKRKEMAYDWLISMLDKEKNDFRLSLIHAVIGAYLLSLGSRPETEENDLQKKEHYTQAKDHYLQALNLRKRYLDQLTDVPREDRDEVEITLRKCYVMLGTVSYYLEDYDACIDYHRQAIAQAEQFRNHFRYESYSRIVGAVLTRDREEEFLQTDPDAEGEALLFEKKWSAAKIRELFSLLLMDIQLMEGGNCMNQRELSDILGKAKELLQILTVNKPEGNAELHDELAQLNQYYYRYFSGSFEELRLP